MQTDLKSMYIVLAVLMYVHVLSTQAGTGILDELERAFILAGENRPQIELALDRVPDDQRPGLEWLVARMPARDLRTLDSEFLLTNTQLAYAAWRESPWHDQITEEIFFDSILP